MTAGAWFARLKDNPTDADREAFQAWIDADPNNLSAYRQVETHWAMLGLAEREPGVRNWRAQALAGGADTVSRRRLLIGGMGGAVAAALAGGVWHAADRDRQVFTTAPRERLTVAFPDGSQAALAPNTRLRMHYAAGERRIDLDRGQAYFVVAHAPERPFRVHAADRVVTALGTQFQVRLEPAGAEVVLAEGRISVVSPQLGAHGAILNAGQKLAANAASPRTTDVLAETAWRSGRLVFHDQRLDEAVDEFNRWSVTPVTVADERAAAVRISGTFSSDSTVDFGRALEAVFGLQVSRIAGGGMLIRSAPPAADETLMKN